MAFHSISAFLLASFAVAISPGPSWVFVISTALRSGVNTALRAVAGNALGIACHAAAASVGVSTLLLQSDVALHIVHWVGAAYLIFLGLRILVRQPQLNGRNSADNPAGRGAFLDGLFVNLLNPKVPALMFAMLPQVVSSATPYCGIQMFLVGILHAFIASLVLTGLAVSAGRGRESGKTRRCGTLLTPICGVVLIVAGIGMLLNSV